MLSSHQVAVCQSILELLVAGGLGLTLQMCWAMSFCSGVHCSGCQMLSKLAEYQSGATHHHRLEALC